MSWEISYYSQKVQEEILAWPAGLQARYLRLTDLMLVHGADLGMPHTRSMGSGLFEIRIKAKEGIGRVMYCTLVGKRIVMLHSFIKKTDKTPLRELEIARRRLQEVKNVNA